MGRADFIKKITDSDGRVIPSRLKLSYLQRHGLISIIEDLSSSDFKTIPEKVQHIIYGGGYCEFCGDRTARAGKGFRRFCQRHQNEEKKKKPAHNRVNFSLKEAVQLYESGMSLIEVGKKLGVSNSTIINRFNEIGYSYRPHSENQKLQFKRKPRPYNGPHVDIGFEELNDLYVNQKTPISTIAKEFNCDSETIRQRLIKFDIDRSHRTTEPEWIIQSFLDSLGVTYRKNDRKLIYPLEVDFFIPEKNLAIEVNGIL